MHHGVPRPQRWLVTTDGGEYRYPGKILFLQVTVHSGTVRLYFEDADEFAADSAGGAYAGTGEKSLELAAGTTEYFEGPVLGTHMLMRGIGGDAQVTLLGYIKPS